MIRGYPGRPSVAPGESLDLHISTDSPRIRVAFYRWNGSFVPMACSPWFEGKDAGPGGAADNWAWPRYTFAIPPDWPSAVYIAHLEEPDAVPLSLSMTSAAALFVVRGSGRSRLLYKLPLATYHAYNCTGGGCFYADQSWSNDPPGAMVSLLRPGGGIGGETWGAPDHYQPATTRQTFGHWDARFIGWLARNGLDAEFCTDLDLHHDPSLCDRHRLVLSVGHDEYWSETTRNCIERFVARGGNAAFFGANLCWWRIRVIRDRTALVCHQGGPRGAQDHWWPPTGAGRPEDALTGLSYRHGGGWWDGARQTDGYIVQDPAHWVFEGTGLRAGEAFGSDTSPPLVGYECDGVPLDGIDALSGRAMLAREAPAAGTPAGLQLLAVSILGDGWQEKPPREMHPANGGLHAAAMVVFSRNGTVFSAGTTDWAQVLDGGQDARVATITRNVLRRLMDG